MSEGILAYLIKPSAGTVQRVRLHGGYEAIYKAGEYECFDCARFAENGDGVFVDDEGLLKPQASDNFFAIVGYPQPLCGNGVVMGVDDEGESIAPKTTWEEFKKIVRHAVVMKIGDRIVESHGPLRAIEDIIDIHA